MDAKTFFVDGWKGDLPLMRAFWQGGAVWFFGFFVTSGIAYLTVYGVQNGVFVSFKEPVVRALFGLSSVLKWVFFFAFIWWCVSVFRAADREPSSIRGLMAKGIVVVLVIGNAISVLV